MPTSGRRPSKVKPANAAPEMSASVAAPTLAVRLDPPAGAPIKNAKPATPATTGRTAAPRGNVRSRTISAATTKMGAEPIVISVAELTDPCATAAK
jgi:hypothetical protein